MDKVLEWFTGTSAKAHFIALLIIIFALAIVVNGAFRDDIIEFVDKHPDILTMILGVLGIGGVYLTPGKKLGDGTAPTPQPKTEQPKGI